VTTGPRTDASGAPPCAADADLVGRGLVALGWSGAVRVVGGLAGGGSGSQVFLVELDGERAVLKVTEDPGWVDRAARELAVYRDLAAFLDGFLPVVRATQQDPGGVRLLLAALDPYPPATALTDDAWVELADRLGRLHRQPVPRPGWLNPRPWPSSEQVAAAVRVWAGHGVTDVARRTAHQLDTARTLLSPQGTVLVHGDSHVGNLLRGPSGPVWADWQETHLGSGLDDLVFLWQRAEFDGAHPPRDTMTAAYTAARGLDLDAGLRSALAASELRLLLVSWPPFLGYGTADQRRVMTGRLQQLVDGWDAAT